MVFQPCLLTNDHQCDEMRMRIANCELLIANCELLIANCELRMRLLLVISLLVSIQSIQRMSNLAKPSPHLTRLPTRLALALAIPLQLPHSPSPLTTPLFRTCTTYYQLCNPGGGRYSGYILVGVCPGTPKTGGPRCGHSP